MRALATLLVPVTLSLASAPAWTAPQNANNGVTAEGQLNGSAEPAKRAKELLEDPLGGVIVNRTVTVLGNDFYRYFATWWRQRDENNAYAISIHERPSARWGSEVWVEYRRNRIFHAFLPPARSRTKEISEYAADIAYRNITQNELQRALFESADLGPEEM